MENTSGPVEIDDAADRVPLEAVQDTIAVNDPGHPIPVSPNNLLILLVIFLFGYIVFVFV